jgi:hypothetical protein
VDTKTKRCYIQSSKRPGGRLRIWSDEQTDVPRGFKETSKFLNGTDPEQVLSFDVRVCFKRRDKR